MNEQVKVLIDFALGDGHIQRYGTKYHYKLEHSIKQMDYFRHKVDILKSLGFTGWERKNEKVVKGKLYYTVSFNLHINGAIKTAYKYIINKGRKAIDRKLLKIADDRTLAYWYMDDGSANKTHKNTSSPGNGYRYYYTYPKPKLSKIRLYTYAFTFEEQLLIQKWLLSEFKIDSRLVHSKRDGIFIVVSRLEDRKQFIKTIKPFIISSMEYKISGLLSYQGIKPTNVCRKRLSERTPTNKVKGEATVQGLVEPA